MNKKILYASMLPPMLSGCSLLQNFETVKNYQQGFTSTQENVNSKSSRHATNQAIPMGDCFEIDNAYLNNMTNLIFEAALKEVNFDPKVYLAGLCLPEDKALLTYLYSYLVTEGTLHSRIVAVKYQELLAIYKKAGVEISVYEDAYRRSTEQAVIRDLQHEDFGTNFERAATFMDNLSLPDDNADFQHTLETGLKAIAEKSVYKKQAKKIFSEVLSHSSLSVFYLTRSAYVISQISDYMNFDLKGKVNWNMDFDNAFSNIGESVQLSLFLFNRQDDIINMLIASVYGMQSITQDAEKIPPMDPNNAADELQELKRKSGMQIDYFEREFAKQNSYPSSHLLTNK